MRPVDINRLGCFIIRQVPNSYDLILHNTYIAIKPGVPGAIDDLTVSEDDIVMLLGEKQGGEKEKY